MLESCNALRKLRLIRRQHARDKNLYSKTNDSHEEKFENVIKQLEAKILNEKSIYEAEKKNLLRMNRIFK